MNTGLNANEKQHAKEISQIEEESRNYKEKIDFQDSKIKQLQKEL